MTSENRFMYRKGDKVALVAQSSLPDRFFGVVLREDGKYNDGARYVVAWDVDGEQVEGWHASNALRLIERPTPPTRNIRKPKGTNVVRK